MTGQMKRFIDVARHKTWKLFGVTNFVALNRPYTTFFAILGYFPYNISSSTYTFSKKWFAWSTMITILFTVVASYSMYIMNFVEKGLQEVSKNLHFNFYLILSLILVLRWYARFRSKLIVYQMICNVSREMPPECFTKIAKWIFSIDFLKFGIFFYILRNVISLKKMSVYSVVAWWSCLLVVTMNVLLRNNIYVLESCLRAINKSLEDLKTSLISDEPHLLRRVYHTQKNPVLLKELKVLRLRHLDILKTIDTVNEVFALENLVIVALLTVDVTFNLYTYLVNYTSDGKVLRVWTDQLIYIVYTSLCIIGIAVACERLKDQAKNIGYNIHRILVITFDEQISTELELFSMQALQQNCTISAKGLVIDATLLTKIVGTIATYLLILIQFLFVKPC